MRLSAHLPSSPPHLPSSPPHLPSSPPHLPSSPSLLPTSSPAVSSSPPPSPPSLRPSGVLYDRLREVARLALDESLGSCDVQDFSKGFPLDRSHQPVLEHVFSQAQSKLRHNSLAEFELIFNELGVEHSLKRLEDRIAQQPLLRDGSRCPVVAESEGPVAISQVLQSAKSQHKLSLEQALREVSRENESLQQRFTAQLPKLLAANEEISSCMLRMQQTATSLEDWSRRGRIQG